MAGTAYVLVDFFNLGWFPRGREASYADVRDVVGELTRAVVGSVAEHLGGPEEIVFRYYGGWYDTNTGQTTEARDILSAVLSADFPTRGRYRLIAAIAEAPVESPHLVLHNTVRWLPRLPSLRIERPRECGIPDHCALDDLLAWSKGRCPRWPSCAVKTEASGLSRGQKMVDTLLVADAVRLSILRGVRAVVIVSDDDDVVPGLLASAGAGPAVIQLRSSRRTDLYYDSLLASVGVQCVSY